MSKYRLPRLTWDEFPDGVKARCKGIADEVQNLGWPSENIEEWAGSYSFKAAYDDAFWTVAKLIPQKPYGDPIIYAAFSRKVPGSEDHARQFNPNVDPCIFQGEPFHISRISDTWHNRRAAEVIYTFLTQSEVQPFIRKRVSL